MMKNKKLCLLKIFFQWIFGGIFSILLLPSSTLANELAQHTSPEDDCQTKQVILLVDQSRSMTRNDPTRLRFDGPLHLADLLAKNYIQAYQRSLNIKLEQPVRIEFAVIQFASEGKVQIGWTAINPVDDDSWSVERAKIKPLLDLTYEDQQALMQEISNGTNFIKAFQKAEELLSMTKQQEGSCPERLVLVMTDGNPDEDVYILSEHMEEVEKIVDENFRLPGNEVYVIAFNVPDSDYWRRSERFWDEITGEETADKIEKAKQANSFGELGKMLADIVINFLGDPATVQIKPGRLVVPPYLERLTITFYKPERESLIELYDDEGLLEPSRPDVEVIMTGEDGAIQTIDIIRPSPGVYELTTDAKKDEYMITQQLIFVSPQLVAPTSSLQQFTQSTIEIKMVDSQGQVIPNYGDPKYALKADASVISNHFEIPITMAHLDTGILQGTFTPIEPGNHLLAVEAIAFDDDAQELEIITSPDADYNLVVEPVTVKIGDKQSTVPTCAPAQYIPLEIPLQVINALTNKLASLSVPVSWEAESDQDADFTFTGPDNNEVYALQIISRESGVLNFTIRALATDPVEGKQHTFFEKEVRVDITPTHLLSLTSSGGAKEADGISLDIYEWREKIFGETDANVILLGRRMFIYPQAIHIFVTLSDDDSDQLSYPFATLPGLNMRDQKSGELYSAEAWQYLGSGRFEAVFSELPPGSYITEFHPQTMPCNLKLDYDPNLTATILVISDFWEYVIVLVAIVLTIIIIVIVALLILCKFKNPLKGFLAIIDGNGKRVWFQSIANRACWSFKMNQPEKQCYLMKIRVVSWHKSNGDLRLWLKRIDPQTGDKEKETHYRSINSWTDVNLPGGCRITHGMTQQELPK